MGFIMVVDDDKAFADITAQVLRKAGHEVLVHTDTEEAFNSVKARHPDLAILDVMFPENPSGGFDLARRLSREAFSLPILILTAVNSCFQFGFSSNDIDQKWLPAVDFLEKPVDFELLLSTVERALQLKSPPSPV